MIKSKQEQNLLVEVLFKNKSFIRSWPFSFIYIYSEISPNKPEKKGNPNVRCQTTPENAG